MTELPSCKGITGRLFGHRFEQRYDYQYFEPNQDTLHLKEALKNYIDNVTFVDEDHIDSITSGFNNCRQAFKSETYKYDICIRCGLTVKESLR